MQGFNLVEKLCQYCQDSTKKFRKGSAADKMLLSSMAGHGEMIHEKKSKLGMQHCHLA